MPPHEWHKEKTMNKYKYMYTYASLERYLIEEYAIAFSPNKEVAQKVIDSLFYSLEQDIIITMELAKFCDTNNRDTYIMIKDKLNRDWNDTVIEQYTQDTLKLAMYEYIKEAK